MLKSIMSIIGSSLILTYVVLVKNITGKARFTLLDMSYIRTYVRMYACKMVKEKLEDIGLRNMYVRGENKSAIFGQLSIVATHFPCLSDILQIKQS